MAASDPRRCVSPVVAALLLLIVVVAGFALIWVGLMPRFRGLARTGEAEVSKLQRYSVFSVSIEYAYVYVNTSTTPPSCTLYAWYSCSPINCSLASIYINDMLVEPATQPQIITSQQPITYYIATPIPCDAVGNDIAVDVKLILVFGEFGSPNAVVKSLEDTVQVVRG